MSKYIECSAVDFRYELSVPLIENFSMKISEGETIGLVGPSGCGKTTLLRLLLGFETQDSGTISYNASTNDQFRQYTAWLPQDLDLGEGTLKDVFYYPFSFKSNRAQKPTDDKILETFDALGLDRRIWKGHFSPLSTGQRQRIGIALIHLLDKPVLLLDEPTSALDMISKVKVEELLSDENKIIVSTSHDPWWLERCSRIIKINPESRYGTR